VYIHLYMEWFLRIWLPIAIAVTGMCAVSLGTAQQLYRQASNDPQVQIAEDMALALESGTKPTALIASSTRIDVSASLRPFTVIYDKDLSPIAWSGEYEGKPPVPPSNIFEDAKGSVGSGESRVTWQPDEETRFAIVVLHVLRTDGYVLTGRNLREAQDRIWDIQALIGLVWLMTLAATLIATWLGARAAAGKTGIVW
jgi:hypothetical protein